MPSTASKDGSILEDQISGVDAMQTLADILPTKPETLKIGRMSDEAPVINQPEGISKRKHNPTGKILLISRIMHHRLQKLRVEDPLIHEEVVIGDIDTRIEPRGDASLLQENCILNPEMCPSDEHLKRVRSSFSGWKIKY
jgi:hypothetical protein